VTPNPLGTQESQRDWQAVGIASGLGCSVVVSLLLCVGGGILLDRWLGTEPILLFVGLVLGLGAAAYSLYELAVLGVPDRGHFGKRTRTRERSQGHDQPQHARDG
jgi:ATP synthase protein I